MGREAPNGWKAADRRTARRAGIAAIIAVVSGCATDGPEKRLGTAPSRVERQCGPAIGARSHLVRHDAPDETDLDPAVTTEFSVRTLQLADIIGARRLLLSIESHGRASALADERGNLARLQLRERLTDRILLALLEVKSAAAEADCEEERADELADRLQEQRDEQVMDLTILSLVGGGVGGMLSGGLALGAQAAASAAAGILAGATESAFGSWALFVDTGHEFRHERNLLAEIWEGPERPRLIPGMVWRFLNRPLPGDPQHRSLRQSLIDRWRRDGRLGAPGSEQEKHRIALFFGAGGGYTIDELRDRANMLDMLEADVNLMSHDLESFLHEMLTVTEH